MAGTDSRKYVERGRGLVAAYDPGWEDDLGEANRRKNGAPFLYADGMIMAAAALRTALRVPYRQLSGMLESMLSGRGSPSYPTLYRRMRLLDVDVRGSEVTVRDPGRRLVMVADATGLKQHSRGERVRHRWRVRRGFVKLHLLIDADTRGVLAAAVTDEKAGDAAQLPALLHMAVGDRRLSGAGGLPRDERLENLRYWKGTVGYGTRWTVEIVISATRRMFGEDLMARTRPNMVREAVMRLAPYNRWAAEAAAV